MRLRWERTSRWPRPPAWAAALAGLWLLLVLAGVLLEWDRGAGMETCLVHRLTGHPCPTCGSTRVVVAFARGAWPEAFRLNPLVALGLLLGGLWLAVRLATGRTPRVALSPRERSWLLVAGVAALLANWAWVLRAQA